MSGRNYKWLEKDMLTPRQLKLYKFIRKYKHDHEVMPTFDDMKSFMNVKSKSVVFHMLGYLEWKGYIKREPAMWRGITITKELT
tara:strand:+ start:52 stop:303 length:252 start_codon:yes stop_codon:yes gene_type:complete